MLVGLGNLTTCAPPPGAEDVITALRLLDCARTAHTREQFPEWQGTSAAHARQRHTQLGIKLDIFASTVASCLNGFTDSTSASVAHP